MMNIAIFGAGGHAKVILDIVACQEKYTAACLFDNDEELVDCHLGGCPVIVGWDAIHNAVREESIGGAIIGIGNNEIRAELFAWLMTEKLAAVSAIHPAATIAKDVLIGGGSVVMAGAVINPATKIGRNVIINTRAGIDHDCEIGDHAHVAPGATLCGGVTVGGGTLVGAGSTILPGINIGSGAIIGAGAVVTHPVASGDLVVGVPARSCSGRDSL